MRIEVEIATFVTLRWPKKVKGEMCCTKLVRRKVQGNDHVYEVYEKVNDLRAESGQAASY